VRAAPGVAPVDPPQAAPDLLAAAEAAPHAEAVARPAPAPSSELAALDIVTLPAGAHVTVDGKALESPSPIQGQPLSPGLHHLALTLPGFERRLVDVGLKPGERRSLDIELRPLHKATPALHGIERAPSVPPGYLTVKTIPWSKVYEGSRLLGTTPFAGVALPAGPHALTFVNPDRPSLTRKVVIHPGGEERISLELPY
jgi:hypothetical protein